MAPAALSAKGTLEPLLRSVFHVRGRRNPVLLTDDHKGGRRSYSTVQGRNAGRVSHVRQSRPWLRARHRHGCPRMGDRCPPLHGEKIIKRGR